MDLVDYLCIEINKGNSALLILLDLSSGFDTVYQEGLIYSLYDLVGIWGTSLNWFCLFLPERSPGVAIDECSLSLWYLSYGEAQGSILLPLLFNMYMKPLHKIRQNQALQSQSFLSAWLHL